MLDDPRLAGDQRRLLFKVRSQSFGVVPRFFDGYPEDSRVGRPWPGRAVTGDPVALGRAVPRRGILQRAQL